MGCKTTLINRVWNVITNGKPQIIYFVLDKNKQCVGGTFRRYLLKAKCKLCGKEFYGRLDGAREYCHKRCSGKISGKLVHNNFTSMPGVKELRLIAKDWIKCAIKSNKIMRPNYCSNCKYICVPDAHHPDYNKPNEVIWLCKSCHMKLHFGHKIEGKLMVY